MEQQPTKEPSKTLIYVSNLAYDTTDEEFQNLFKEFNVKTAYIAKRKSGKSKGFGFVNFETENDQKSAIQKIDGIEFKKRKLGAKVAFNDNRRNENGELREEFKTQTQSNQTPSETVVHVSNISWSLRTQDLVEMFEKIGLKPKFARIARRFGRSRGYGFLEFNTKEEQEKALTLNGTKQNDREILVKPSTNFRPPRTTNNNPQTKRLPNGNNKESKNLKIVRRTERVNDNTLYIKNLPFELDNEDLRSIFQEFNASNANIVSNPRNGRSRGYGFVEFSNPKDRDEALKALDQSEVNGRVITIKVSNGERAPRNRSRSRNNRRNNYNNNNNNRSRSRNNRRNNYNNNNNNNNYRNRSSSNRNRRTNQTRERNNENREVSSNMVYVSNLPFVVEDKEFGEIFANLKFNNAYIAKRRNGKSKGFGFIEFASTEDQQNALKFNGKDVRGRNIVVQAAFKNDRNQQK